jgi:hypothetical protein
MLRSPSKHQMQSWWAVGRASDFPPSRTSDPEHYRFQNDSKLHLRSRYTRGAGAGAVFVEPEPSQTHPFVGAAGTGEGGSSLTIHHLTSPRNGCLQLIRRGRPGQATHTSTCGNSEDGDATPSRCGGGMNINSIRSANGHGLLGRPCP